jgi:transposase
MNKLPRDRRVQIISLLTEGMSLRAITRITGASINTVTALFVTAGKACADYQDRAFRNLTCKRLQVDEIWAFATRNSVMWRTQSPRRKWLAICGRGPRSTRTRN